MFRRKEDYRDYNLSKRFINIAEGCSFTCTFCTHKPGLGPRRSRPLVLTDILGQIAKCIDEDVKVVNLMELGTRRSMARTSLCCIPNCCERSLNSAIPECRSTSRSWNPHGVDPHDDELLPLFSNPRVSHIQVPIQSTSTRLLKMMNCKNYSEQVGPFTAAVRAANRRAVLRT